MAIILTEKTWKTYSWARYTGTDTRVFKNGELYLIDEITQGSSWTRYHICGQKEDMSAQLFQKIPTYETDILGIVPQKGKKLKNFKCKKAKEKEPFFEVKKTSRIKEVAKMDNGCYRVLTKDSCYIIGLLR